MPQRRRRLATEIYRLSTRGRRLPKEIQSMTSTRVSRQMPVKLQLYPSTKVKRLN
jgi:hypothetical protein